MPTILRWKGWRFHIYAGDPTTRPHIHITKEGAELAVWLDDFSEKTNIRVNAKDARMLSRHVESNAETLREAWNELFG